MLELIDFNGRKYPKFQTNGFAARFAFPFAAEVCSGYGIDVGCNRLEWKFPGAEAVDPAINNYDALNFPQENLDYIFSSHCLEHIPCWPDVLDHWTSRIKSGGVIFLYLPDYSQEYWRPWNNRKHVNIFTPQIIGDYFRSTHNFSKVYVSGVDLYNSFMVIAEKA